jgi:hypothetical protein
VFTNISYCSGCLGIEEHKKDDGRSFSQLSITIKPLGLDLLWHITNRYLSLSLVHCNELEWKQKFLNNCYFFDVTDRTVHHEGFVTQCSDQTCDLLVSNAFVIRCFFQNRVKSDGNGSKEAREGGQEACAENFDSNAGRAPPTFPFPGKIR